MKFLKYLKTFRDEDEAIFRSLSIGLVEKETGYANVVEKTNHKSLKLLENINKELKKSYKGEKYKFDFVLDENTCSIDVLKIKQSRKSFLNRMVFEFNDKLGDLQIEYEKQIKNINNNKR